MDQTLINFMQEKETSCIKDKQTGKHQSYQHFWMEF